VRHSRPSNGCARWSTAYSRQGEGVASALTSQLNSRVNQAITAIEKFSQASVRQVEEYCTRSQEKLIASARDELLRRIQADLTQAEERLQNQLDVALTKIQETSRSVVKDAASQAHLVLAESVDFLKDTAREFQGQYSTQLRETTDRTAAELSAETVRFSDRQFALLAKQAQLPSAKVRQFWSARPPKRVRSSKLRPAKCWRTFISEPISKSIKRLPRSTRSFKSSLTSIADEIRENWEARQRAWQDEVAQSTEQKSEQFRQRLETILRSSMVTAISAVNEQSRSCSTRCRRKRRTVERSHSQSRVELNLGQPQAQTSNRRQLYGNPISRGYR